MNNTKFYKLLKQGYHNGLRLLHLFTPTYYKIFPFGRWDGYSNLEIGAGSVRRKDWLSLDYRPGSDVVWDLMNSLPFSSNKFEHIYSSHVLEHFDYKQLMFVLGELFRVLKPGGKMSICVPDAQIYINAYNTRESKDLLRHKPAILSNCRMDFMNYIFYMDGEHKMMFDAENLSFHLKKIGFCDFTLRQYDPLLDGEDRVYESLYALCYKPKD